MGEYRLKITVEEVEGDCHVHEEGDQFTVDSDGQTLRLNNTDKICTYVLGGILPMLAAFTKDLPEDDWMSFEEQTLRCVDPGPGRGGVGTIYMKVERERV